MSDDAKTRIEVNGREYASVDDMPPDVRQLYEEAMRQLREQGPGEPGEAIPAGAGSPETHTTIRTTRRLIVNGKAIDSLDELPEDMRAMVRRALASAGEVETVVVSDELGEADPKRTGDRPASWGTSPRWSARSRHASSRSGRTGWARPWSGDGCVSGCRPRACSSGSGSSS